MKISKLMENISRNKIDDMTRFKVSGKLDIILHIDDERHKTFFTDENNHLVDIMDYINDDFEMEMVPIKEDIYDEVYKQLNNENSNSNIHHSIGTDNSGTRKLPRLTESMMRAFLSGNAELKPSVNAAGYEVVKKNHKQGEYKLKDDGTYEYVSYYERELKDYSYEDNQSYGFYYTGDGYLDAALVLMIDYEKRFERVYDYANTDKSPVSYGYQQDTIIKTLLAFSCECYLKSLLLNQGKTIRDIKSLSHGLVDLYNALENDLMADIFLDMEKNGYHIDKYKSNNIPYDNPSLTEKFMLELGKTSDAFIDSRYSAEDDKNTNYQFLLRFAKSLKNISSKTMKIKSCFDDGFHIKR